MEFTIRNLEGCIDNLLTQYDSANVELQGLILILMLMPMIPMSDQSCQSIIDCLICK